MDRRNFLRALAAAPLFTRLPAFAQETASRPLFLDVVSRTIEVNRRPAKVFGLVGPGGQPGLTLDAGSTFDVALSNKSSERTLVHWHGLTPPNAMDGVPDAPKPLMQAGETRRYTFPVGDGGTHWMHAHTLQEQNLLAAPLIVRTAEDRLADVQDVVLMLHDFSFTPPERLLANLRRSAGGMDSMHGMGMGMGMGMGGMAMDVNDIEFDAYLANDRTLDDPEIVQIEKSGRVRLRIINAATATAFTIDVGNLDADLVSVDGQPVSPLRNRLFPIVMGQRIDLLLQTPAGGGAFPILALRDGAPERTGTVLVTSGAQVRKLSTRGTKDGPAVGMDLETALRAARPPAARAVDRRFSVTLTGGMHGYEWGIVSSAPLRVRRGERIEIAIRNMSMMTHPMHLHGHRFQIVGVNGRRMQGAVRDTVPLTHMGEIVLAFDADNPGKWAFHCHHLYHMAAGMMAFMEYEEAA